MKKVVVLILVVLFPMALWATSKKPVHQSKHHAKQVKHKTKLSKRRSPTKAKHKKNVHKKVRKKIAKKASPARIEKDNRELLTESNLLYQMWALSRNYQFGTTVHQDPVKAFVWLALYVESLPKSYPGVYAMLDQLRAQLSKAELNQSYHLIKVYRQQYNLHFRLTEDDMVKASTLNDNNYQLTVSPDKQPLDQMDFTQLIAHLNKVKKAELALQLQQQMMAAKQATADVPNGRVIFGQVAIAGPELPQDVAAQMPILQDGYFVTAVKDKNMNMGFRMNGYYPININFADAPEDVINVGQLVLQPVAKKQLASLVGRLPLNGMQLKKLNIVLHVTPGPINSIDGQVAQRDPWYWPSASVVILPNGQFYAKNLSPTDYTLVISEPGYKSVSMQVSLNPGELKELGSVKLQKTA